MRLAPRSIWPIAVAPETIAIARPRKRASPPLPELDSIVCVSTSPAGPGARSLNVDSRTPAERLLVEHQGEADDGDQGGEEGEHELEGERSRVAERVGPAKPHERVADEVGDPDVLERLDGIVAFEPARFGHRSGGAHLGVPSRHRDKPYPSGRRNATLSRPMGMLAHVSSGVFEPLQIAGLTAFGAAYGIRAANLARDGRPVPTWRVVSYFSGIVLIAIAFVSPLAHLGGELVTAHMIQHLLIGDIAALLIVLGLTRSVLQPVMALKAFDRLRFLTLPMIALPLWIANLYIWHIPALYDGTVTNEWLHALQHACFITFGILMWMPIAGPLPVPSWFGGGAQVGYMIIARLASAGPGEHPHVVGRRPLRGVRSRARTTGASRPSPTRARRA